MAKVSVWLRVKAYLLNIAISFDQFAGSFIPGSYPDETISARCYRQQWRRAERFVNALFNDPNHCRNAYLSERKRAHSPQEKE
jgi:hypothetical protein